MEKIFEPFYRVDSSHPEGRNASGLGLSIVRGLVELHGGSIHVKSTVGNGSSFTVVLPPIHHPVILPLYLIEAQ